MWMSSSEKRLLAILTLCTAASISAFGGEPPQRWAQNRPDFQAYDNYDLTGTTLRSVTNVDLQACAAACQSENQCQAYSFDKWNRQCSLRGTIGSLRFEPSSVAGISGSLPPMSSAPWEMLRIRGRFDAVRYHSQTTSSYEQCEQACENQQNCVGLTYLARGQTCKLFPTIDGFSVDQNTESGLKHQATTVAVTAPPAGAPVDAVNDVSDAVIARKRSCAAEYKANKAAGKLPAGMSFLQYWDECNKRIPNEREETDRAGREVREVCAADAQRLCSDFVPDVDKIQRCMNRNQAQLSPACRRVWARPLN